MRARGARGLAGAALSLVALADMMDFGSFPIERQLLVSAQFLAKELPVRLAHRVAELENLPFGLSTKRAVHAVRDWYVNSSRAADR